MVKGRVNIPQRVWSRLFWTNIASITPVLRLLDFHVNFSQLERTNSQRNNEHPTVYLCSFLLNKYFIRYSYFKKRVNFLPDVSMFASVEHTTWMYVYMC